MVLYLECGLRRASSPPTNPNYTEVYTCIFCDNLVENALLIRVQLKKQLFKQELNVIQEIAIAEVVTSSKVVPESLIEGFPTHVCSCPPSH